MTEQNIQRKTLKTDAITQELLSGLDVAEGRVFTIGETSSLCYKVKPHVLRYWESQFPNLRPIRRKERRYYKREDIITIRNIYNLVHLNRYTVAGAKKFFDKHNVDQSKTVPDKSKLRLLNIIKSLENIDHELLAD